MILRISLCLRFTANESVQFFQFDCEGNMYMFPPGAGCTGVPKLVQPGDEMIFSGESFQSEISSTNVMEDSQLQVHVGHDGGALHTRTFNEPLKTEDLEELAHKNFSPETLKKIKWVTKMFHEWRTYRNNQNFDQKIDCDLDEKNTITWESLNIAMPHFITEVKKVNGQPYPGKTLYDIVICVQFHLETMGFCYKLLNEDGFREIKWSLDNVMELRTSQGVGVPVHKAQI